MWQAKQDKIKNLSKAKQKVQRYGHLEQKHSKQSKQNVKIYENMGQTEQQKTKFKTRHQSKGKQNVKMYRNMEQNKTNNQKRFSDKMTSKQIKQLKYMGIWDKKTVKSVLYNLYSNTQQKTH